MARPETFISGLSVVITAFTLLVTFLGYNIAVQTFNRGAIPEKSLSYTTLSGSDAMTALDQAGNAISVSVKAGGKAVNNLFVVTTFLKNDGHAPILPSDIFEDITITTTDPWQIITVTSPEAPGNVSFKWTKISERQFSAKPALLNPGDVVTSTVYMTHSSNVKMNIETEPPLYWTARIANLSAIKPQPIKSMTISGGLLPIYVNLYGNGVLLLFVSFIVYLLAFIYLMGYNNFMPLVSGLKAVSIVLVILLSLCAAEAGTSYIFPPLFGLGINSFLNLPFIFLTWIFLLYLLGRYFLIIRKKGVP